MQLSVHYKEKDQYLVEKLEKMAERNRMSTSACILSILEDHFESNRMVGQILKDMQLINNEQLQRALSKQREIGDDKKIGKIMVESNYLKEDQLDRALEIQTKTPN